MMRALLPVVLFLVFSTVLWVAMDRHDAQGHGPGESPLIGHAVPEVAAQAYRGKGIDWEALHGKPYLLNLFASWCAPCIEELPLLQQLANAGLPVVGIAWKDTEEGLKGFFGGDGTGPYHMIGMDRGGMAVTYGITGVPESLLIGADGLVVAHVRGGLSQEWIDAHVTPLLARP